MSTNPHDLILRVLQASPKALTITQIARSCGLARSTVRKYLMRDEWGMEFKRRQFKRISGRSWTAYVECSEGHWVPRVTVYASGARFSCTYACLLADAERVAREIASERELCAECWASHPEGSEHVPWVLSASVPLRSAR